MAVSPGFRDFVSDLLEPLGGVGTRRMFGGLGVFRDGLMFGLVFGETLYLKVDDGNRAEFEAAGAEPFTYGRKDGQRTVLGYMALPHGLYDEPEVLLDRARGAFEAARRKDAARTAPKPGAVRRPRS